MSTFSDFLKSLGLGSDTSSLINAFLTLAGGNLLNKQNQASGITYNDVIKGSNAKGITGTQQTAQSMADMVKNIQSGQTNNPMLDQARLGMQNRVNNPAALPTIPAASTGVITPNPALMTQATNLITPNSSTGMQQLMNLMKIRMTPRPVV